VPDNDIPDDIRSLNSVPRNSVTETVVPIRRGRPSKADGTRQRVDKRRTEVVQRRLAGWTWERVADHINTTYGHHGKYSRRHAKADWDVATEGTGTEQIEEALGRELVRTEALIEATWDAATGGNVKAGYFILAVMDRRAKYLQLDAPQRHEVLTADMTEVVTDSAKRRDEAMRTITEIIESRRAALGS